MKERPEKQMIKVRFYKDSGKYYTEGEAFVDHFQFEDAYKQDIVNSQNAMRDGWQGRYFVAVSSEDPAVGFHDALFLPQEFEGIKKQK